MMKTAELEAGFPPTPSSITKVYVSDDSKIIQQSSERSPNVSSRKQPWLQHGLFLVFIGCLSAGLGVATYYGAHAPEFAVFQTQLNSCFDQIQNTVASGLGQTFAASRMMQHLFGYAAKYGYGTSQGQTPPFFTLPGFQDYATELNTLAGGNLRSVGFAPLIDTTDSTVRPAWEAWSKQNIAVQTAGYDAKVFNLINGTAFNYGIYSAGPPVKKRSDDVIAGTDPRFKNWLFPVWQIFPIQYAGVVVYLEDHIQNVQTIDNILTADYGTAKGGAFTDVFQLVQDTGYRPSTIVFAPIFSIGAIPKLLGLSSLVFSWDSIMVGSLPNNIKRMDCVVSSKTTTFTIAIDQGTVSVVGEGDSHDPAMTAYGKTITIDLSKDSPLSISDFKIVVYPSAAFYKQYNTSQPSQIAIVVAVLVFVVFILMYLNRMYDQQQKQKLREEEEHLKRSQAEAKLAEAEAAANASEAGKQRQLKKDLLSLATNTVHEIKSPTCALELAVESLIRTLTDNNKVSSNRGQPLDADERQELVHTLRGMEHTITTVSMITNRHVELSEFISNEKVKLIPQKMPVDVNRLLQGVARYVAWQALNTDVEVDVESLPTGLPTEIMADEKWLKSDLMCMISNATKYTRGNLAVIVRVEILEDKSTGTAQKMVRFVVMDSGVHLTADKFKSFFALPPLDRLQEGGKSMGLFCLGQHVEAMGGKCGAQKRTDGNEGTEVWFTIPLVPVTVDRKERKKSFVFNDEGVLQTVVKSHMSKSKGISSMLLVDDSAVILKLMKRCIQADNEKIVIAEAKNGVEAFNLAKAKPFNVIVTDIHMPVLNGFEMTKQIRQLEKEKNLPATIIIGISGNSTEEIALQAQESGMNGFMRKPFALHTLMEIIEDNAPEVPKTEEENLEEMMQVILEGVTSERGRMFYTLAQKSLTTENIDFIRAVSGYETEAAMIVHRESGIANDIIRTEAKKLYETYIKQNCDQEVNVCAATRGKVEAFLLKSWEDNSPTVALPHAMYALKNDIRKQIFQTALKEILQMTYQNLWNKFRGEESVRATPVSSTRNSFAEESTKKTRSSLLGSFFSGSNDRGSRKNLLDKGTSSAPSSNRNSFADRVSVLESFAETVTPARSKETSMVDFDDKA